MSDPDIQDLYERMQKGEALPDTYFEGEKVQDFEDLLEI
jgi:hypothetical protein